MNIYGHVSQSGIVLCVECRPTADGKEISDDDHAIALRCDQCKMHLRDVPPMQSGEYGHESQDAYDEGQR